MLFVNGKEYIALKLKKRYEMQYNSITVSDNIRKLIKQYKIKVI